MKFYTHDEILDKHIGKKGSSARESFDAEVEAISPSRPPTKQRSGDVISHHYADKQIARRARFVPAGEARGK